MAEKSLNEVVNSLVSGMDVFLSTKTVVGEPTKISDDTMIVPFIDVSFGVGAGDFKGEKKNNSGGGLTGKMSPCAVLVISKGTSRVINIKNQDSMSKILDMVPDLVNKFAGRKDQGISDDEAVELAIREAEKEA